MHKGKEFDFLLQAEEGLIAQNDWRHILLNKKFEHKFESNLWHSTGNIAIEYESYGKPSGVAVTEAEYWTHELRSKEGKILAYLTFPTHILRRVCNTLLDQEPDTAWRRGGENKKMEMIVLNLSRLFQLLSATEGEGDPEFIMRKLRSVADE